MAASQEIVSFRCADSAVVDPTATIGAGTVIWDLTRVRERATIGAGCVIGQGVYVDHGVVVGDRCKVQNNAQLFAPATLGSGVFVGPGAILTNDLYPRAVTPEGTVKQLEDWTPDGVVVGDGASLGAGCVVISGVAIGDWAVVGAGAVVTRDVPPHALVVGSPARPVGWVGRSGLRLQHDEASASYVDAASGEAYREVDGRLEVIE